MSFHDYIGNADPAVIEGLYEQFKADPSQLDEGWRRFFEGFEFSKLEIAAKIGEELTVPKEFKILNLIQAYRSRGHLFTETNPVRVRRKYKPGLEIENFGLSKDDLDTEFEAGSEIGIGKATLRTIVNHLKDTYARHIGVEYSYIRNPEIVGWLKGKMESSRNLPNFPVEQKEAILKILAKAVYFEKFIHKRFPGQKRFSLEGVESLVCAIEAIILRAGELNYEESIIGMPHRGRLNMLANVMKKPYRNIFREFQSTEYEEKGLLGDVKYHLGQTHERKTPDGKSLMLTLSPNPSHLEAVDPVVIGIAKARIDQKYQGDFKKIVPILIHGDASISGQGVVYEVVQMAGLEPYSVGGTIHLVANNQIGFTTNYTDGRTSTYCTDVAKVTQSPVFHVNADDVESVMYTVMLAMEFREKFHKDVFIDLLGYRKYGHNESDEPRFTQPLLYKVIEKHPNPFDIYFKKLLGEGIVTEEEGKSFIQDFNSKLDEAFEESKQAEKVTIQSFLAETWEGIKKAYPVDFQQSPDTGVDKSILRTIGEKITNIPPDLTFFRKTIKLQKDRKKMLDDGQLDWAMGELLAYGTLVNEGFAVRVSGQDVERGTFSHRHAVLTIEGAEEDYIPLNQISSEQAKFEIYNSTLSEYGVLGFEYGYSLTSPHSLTIWEAQFGDFANTAQVIFDQFISSAEDKWNVMNDLVVLLPHGYEGQGPEHSSARLERFLALAAQNNIQVVNCTSPASFFHVLRRQLHREFRKPLIVFTPKSLLRHPKCISPIEELSDSKFKEVIDDESAEVEKIIRVAFCSGKIYYDLLAEKEKLKNTDVAIIRIEQLYPFPKKQVQAIIDKYKFATRWVWVQEEPANMGAWSFISQKIKKVPVKLIARPASGSPATGSSKFHQTRQDKILEKTFTECSCDRINEECKMICIGNDYTNYI